MPPARPQKTAAKKARSLEDAPLALIWGDDDYAVKQRARQVFTAWTEKTGEFDQEIIEATAENADHVTRILARLREALQTLPFFGGAKVVWLKDCNFLGDGRLSEAASVTAAVGGLAAELQRFSWEQVRLLISAGKVDRRRAFYKMVQAVGAQEVHESLSAAKDWEVLAERFARDEFARHGQTIEPAALVELVAAVGPHLRTLAAEVEKLSLYAGDRREITRADVAQITSRTHQAEAFAVAEALGDRDLPRALRTLDEELWQIRTDRSKSPIGLLYGLISKVRLLLLVKELVRLRHLSERVEYRQVKAALERLPADLLPPDRQYNPAKMHPFPVFKAVQQSRHYTGAELREAMDRLLQANLRLVSSALDPTLVLQEALIQIIGGPRPAARHAPPSSPPRRGRRWSPSR